MPLKRSDEQLVRQAAAGDERAFASIYERHQDALYRYCLTIVRDPDDARDVLQSVMANALAALRRGAPDAPVRPWLFRITHNEAISALRRRRPTAALDDDAIAPDLEVTVEQRARLRQLVADLRALPERQRGALVMRELSGLSHAEIATALGISAPQAKQAILEARVSLQEAEKGRAMHCPDVRRVISAQDGRRLRARSVRAHLRGCDDCRALRDAIATRSADLRVLAPPAPAAVGAGLLASLLGGGGSWVAKGAIGLTAVVGAGAGVTGVVRSDDRDRPPANEREATSSSAAPGAGSGGEADPDADGTAIPGFTTATSSDPSRPGVRARVRARRGRPGPGTRGQGQSRPGTPAAGAPGTAGGPQAGEAPGQGKPPKPAKTPKPDKVAKPGKTPRPAKTPKPDRTPRPVRTPRPAKTPPPVATPRPERTPRPAPSVVPTTTPPPVEAPKPDKSKK